MLDLKRRKNDVRLFVRDLEEWLIRALAEFNVKGERRAERIGIWISHGDGSEDKIAAIGVRVRHWVTFHGISLNVDPELEHFSGIVPCGVRDERFGVTSLAALGLPVSMDDVDVALKRSFEQVFGPVPPLERFPIIQSASFLRKREKYWQRARDYKKYWQRLRIFPGRNSLGGFHAAHIALVLRRCAGLRPDRDGFRHLHGRNPGTSRWRPRMRI